MAIFSQYRVNIKIPGQKLHNVFTLHELCVIFFCYASVLCLHYWFVFQGLLYNVQNKLVKLYYCCDIYQKMSYLCVHYVYTFQGWNRGWVKWISNITNWINYHLSICSRVRFIIIHIFLYNNNSICHTNMLIISLRFYVLVVHPWDKLSY